MIALEQDVKEQLGAAAEWRLLSLLFSRPREGWYREVSSLAEEVGVEGLREAARAAQGATEGAYHALLGPGGRASAREAASAGFGDLGRILADLAARYDAFGFTPRQEEADDHLAVECDFVSYLHLKEAYALSGGNPGAAEVTREARALFLSEHAAVAGRRLAERLPVGSPAYLEAAAAVLAERLPELPPVPEGAFDPDPMQDGCPAACGPGQE